MCSWNGCGNNCGGCGNNCSGCGWNNWGWGGQAIPDADAAELWEISIPLMCVVNS